MHSYYCENCGREVAEDEDVCPACGSFFSAVKCPACDYRAKAHRFYRGCPRCGYLSEAPNREAQQSSDGSPAANGAVHGKGASGGGSQLPRGGTATGARGATGPTAGSRRKELPSWVLFVALVFLIVLAAALPVLL